MREPTTPTGGSAGSSLVTRLTWRARAALSPDRRAALRRATDPWVGPAGSICGADVDDAVALTFDDGPSRWTMPVLDVLDRHGATATFFVLVDRAEAAPDALRSIVERGHEVALHGLTHDRTTSLPRSAARAHIAEGKRRVEQCLGRPIRFYRPPFGAQSPLTFLAARRAGLHVVAWTCDADDWIDHDPATIATLALERLQPGGVLLLHDGFESDRQAPLPEPQFDRVEALDQLLTGLADRGLRSSSVGDLLASGRTRRTAWFRP